MRWSLYRFIEAGGKDPVRVWLSQLAAPDRAAVDRRVQQMEQLVQLPSKWIKSYKTLPGIIELRIKGDRKQLRPLACYLPGDRIVILAGAIEYGDELDPKSAKKAAVKRRNEVLAEQKRAKRYFED